MINRSLVTYWQVDDHKLTFFDIKSHLRFYLCTICVIFGDGDYYLLCKGKFVFLQWEIFLAFLSIENYVVVSSSVLPSTRTHCLQKLYSFVPQLPILSYILKLHKCVLPGPHPITMSCILEL